MKSNGKSWWTVLYEKEHQSKLSSTLVDGWGGTTDGKRFSLFMEGHNIGEVLNTRDALSTLWRGSKTLWETVSFPALPLRQSSKRCSILVHGRPVWNPRLHPLEHIVDVKVALHHCPPGAFSSEQVTNPTLSFEVTLHTSIFSLKKWLRQQGHIFV